MSRLMKLAMLACTAVFAMAFFAGAAAALRSIGISTAEGGRRIRTEGASTFDSREAFRFRVTCESLRLNGELAAAAIAKLTALPTGKVGTIQEGSATGCRESLGGAAEIRITVPIDLRYNSILGTLPNITGILVVALNARFQIRAALTCIYEGTVGFLFEVNERREITRGRFLQELVRKTAESPGACPATGAIIGTMNVSPAVRVSLL